MRRIAREPTPLAHLVGTAVPRPEHRHAPHAMTGRTTALARAGTSVNGNRNVHRFRDLKSAPVGGDASRRAGGTGSADHESSVERIWRAHAPRRCLRPAGQRRGGIDERGAVRARRARRRMVGRCWSPMRSGSRGWRRWRAGREEAGRMRLVERLAATSRRIAMQVARLRRLQLVSAGRRRASSR